MLSKYLNSLLITALFFLLIFTSSSCKKSFLETVPKGKLIAQTVSDYDLLLNSNNLLNTGGANAHVFLGDEVAVAEPYFSTAEPRTQNLFKWEANIYETSQDAPETASLLSQLYTYNKIINEVGDATGGSEQQKNSIRAEALAGRAWVYFMLINYFGKPYTQATAANDPGFPIVKVADVNGSDFSRASVQDVYNLILEDLTTAIPDLPVQTTYRIRMSKAAGQALLGKVHMFMGNYSEALPLLNNALDNINSSAIPIELTDYNIAFAPGGSFLPVSFFGPSTPVINNNPETIYARQFSNFWITTSELVISPATVSLFDSSDLRLMFFANTPFPIGPPYQAGLLRRMGPLTTSYGVILPDLILLRAECLVRMNDLTGAVADLEALRLKRMPQAEAMVPAAVSSQQLPLLKYVFEERIREFASEGVRWFDMRRISVDPLFSNTVFIHQIFNEDGSKQEFTLPAERLVLKIPPKILAENPGLVDNP